jgi:hypothetical protein
METFPQVNLIDYVKNKRYMIKYVIMKTGIVITELGKKYESVVDE